MPAVAQRRIRHVYSDKTEILRRWYGGESEQLRTLSGNFFSSGNAVYSYGYHFPLIVRLKDDIFLLNTDKYSLTTTRHQHTVGVFLWQRGEQINTLQIPFFVLHEVGVFPTTGRIRLLANQTSLALFTSGLRLFLWEAPLLSELRFGHHECAGVGTTLLKPDNLRVQEEESHTRAVRLGPWYFLPVEARVPREIPSKPFLLDQDSDSFRPPFSATRGFRTTDSDASGRPHLYVTGVIRHVGRRLPPLHLKGWHRAYPSTARNSWIANN